MTSAPCSMWSRLWEGAQDLSSLVTTELRRKDKEGLRGAIRAARTATNASLSKVEILREEDLRDLLQLRLQERFPNLGSVALRGYVKDIAFTRFASETLAKLPRLTTVDLSGCKALDPVTACAALVQCSHSRLEKLSLPYGAHLKLCLGFCI
jgi:hypothetical protein